MSLLCAFVFKQSLKEETVNILPYNLDAKYSMLNIAWRAYVHICSHFNEINVLGGSNRAALNIKCWHILYVPEGIEVDCVFVLVGVDFGINALESGGEEVQKVIHSVDLMTQQFDCSQTLFHPFDCRLGVCESCVDGTHCLK